MFNKLTKTIAAIATTAITTLSATTALAQPLTEAEIQQALPQDLKGAVTVWEAVADINVLVAESLDRCYFTQRFFEKTNQRSRFAQQQRKCIELEYASENTVKMLSEAGVILTKFQLQAQNPISESYLNRLREITDNCPSWQNIWRAEIMVHTGSELEAYDAYNAGFISQQQLASTLLPIQEKRVALSNELLPKIFACSQAELNLEAAGHIHSQQHN